MFHTAEFVDKDGDSIVSVASSSNRSAGSGRSTESARKKSQVKKTTKTKNGGKLDQSLVLRSKSPTCPDLLPVPTASKAPNLSRKFRDLKLYAFPSFDKCDSLVFFPSTMSRHLNSGDYSSLAQLMAAHLHRQCAVRISPTGNYRINAATFIKMFEVMNEAHPDSVLCVHTTKVVENVINARMYFKFTDSQIINQSMARRLTDETFNPMFARPRSDRFKDNMNLTSKSSAERAAINAIVDSDVDLVVYGKVDLRLIFDGAKKVTDIDFMCEFTSLSTTQVSALMDGEEI